MKLYNSGSFFDPQAIPAEDFPAVAERVCQFARVIVECHPALVRESCAEFANLLASKARSAILDRAPQLEVAMGLETVHPEILDRLNKRMTVDLFARAAEFLRAHGIALRVFILVQPPFLNASEGLHWTRRSIDVAFDLGATVVSLIPTRTGSGALDALEKRGDFTPPALSALESALVRNRPPPRQSVFGSLGSRDLFPMSRLLSATCRAAAADESGANGPGRGSLWDLRRW